MFDKLKQINELRQLQNQMKQERETAQKKGITVTVNGAMEVLSVTLNPALDQREAEVAIAECVNDAMKSIQRRMAKTMMGSGFGGL